MTLLDLKPTSKEKQETIPITTMRNGSVLNTTKTTNPAMNNVDDNPTKDKKNNLHVYARVSNQKGGYDYYRQWGPLKQLPDNYDPFYSYEGIIGDPDYKGDMQTVLKTPSGYYRTDAFLLEKQYKLSPTEVNYLETNNGFNAPDNKWQTSKFGDLKYNISYIYTSPKDDENIIKLYTEPANKFSDSKGLINNNIKGLK